MVCYSGDDWYFRPNSHKKYCRHLSGQWREFNKDQRQVNCHDDATYTSDHHGGILRLPAFSAPAPAPRMHLGSAHDPCGSTHAGQPGTLRTGNRQLESGTAASTKLSGGTQKMLVVCR